MQIFQAVTDLVESLSRFRALILPEQKVLSPQEIDAIRQFVRAGGALIATGESGVRDRDNRPLPDFALAEVFGVRRTGASELRRAYLRIPAAMAAAGLPKMDLQIRAPYTKIRTTTAETLIDAVAPFGAKQAPSEDSDGPGLTVNRFGNGIALYCALPVFEAYHREGASVLRKLAAWMLGRVHPEQARPLLLENTPLNVEVVYSARGRERFLHLLNYTGDKRLEGAPRIQDFSSVQGIRVRLRLDEKPKRIVAIPANSPITFSWNDGWARFEAQPLMIHGVYRVEA